MKMAEGLIRWVISVIFSVAEVAQEILYGFCAAVTAGLCDGLEGVTLYQGDGDGAWYFHKVERKRQPDWQLIDEEGFSRYVDSLLKGDNDNA